MSAQYNDVQLDALRELANIGAGTASTALSEMLGRSIDLAVPDVSVLPMADAVDQLGPPEQEITGIMLGVEGERPTTGSTHHGLRGTSVSNSHSIVQSQTAVAACTTSPLSVLPRLTLAASLISFPSKLRMKTHPS